MKTRYDMAMDKARHFLGEDDTTDPQVTSIQSQIAAKQAQIDALDKQRAQLVIAVQDLKKQATNLGGIVSA